MGAIYLLPIEGEKGEVIVYQVDGIDHVVGELTPNGKGYRWYSFCTLDKGLASDRTKAITGIIRKARARIYRAADTRHCFMSTGAYNIQEAKQILIQSLQRFQLLYDLWVASGMGIQIYDRDKEQWVEISRNIQTN